MDRRRRNLLQRIGDVLRGAVGGGRRQPPPPPPEREEPQSIPEEPPRPPPRAPIFDFRGNVKYEEAQYTIVSSHSKLGKAFNYTQRVSGRWTVGSELYPPDISDVSDLLRSANKSGWVTLIIGGASPTPYPGQEDQTTTWKGYSYQMENLEDYADDPNNDTATDWMNSLLRGTAEFWEEVYYVQILNR